jgi:hypothetical protein
MKTGRENNPITSELMVCENDPCVTLELIVRMILVSH